MPVRRCTLFQQGEQPSQQLRFTQRIGECTQHRMSAQVIRRPLLVVHEQVAQKGLITLGQRVPFREGSVIGRFVVTALFFRWYCLECKGKLTDRRFPPSEQRFQFFIHKTSGEASDFSPPPAKPPDRPVIAAKTPL